MAKVHARITDDLRDWILAQHLFFVASAPLTADGHVNVSPKGKDCLRVLDDHTVAYLDMTGSGNETSAHLAENGRVTFMWCGVAGPPRILRLYGRGRVVLPGDAEWDALMAHFTPLPGMRQIVVNDVERVQTSCGYVVPLFDYVDQRDTMDRWVEAKGDDDLVAYRREKNTTSIDGLQTPIGAVFAEE